MFADVGGGASFGREDSGNARVESGGGVVVGKVALTSGSLEEMAYVVALLGKGGEAFCKDRRVIVTPPDELSYRLQPGGALFVEVTMQALIEPVLMFVGREVGLRWTGWPSVAGGYAVSGAPHRYVARETGRKSGVRWQPLARALDR